MINQTIELDTRLSASPPNGEWISLTLLAQSVEHELSRQLPDVLRSTCWQLIEAQAPHGALLWRPSPPAPRLQFNRRGFVAFDGLRNLYGTFRLGQRALERLADQSAYSQLLEDVKDDRASHREAYSHALETTLSFALEGSRLILHYAQGNRRLLFEPCWRLFYPEPKGGEKTCNSGRKSRRKQVRDWWNMP
jgi:hypothetical protein